MYTNNEDEKFELKLTDALKQNKANCEVALFANEVLGYPEAFKSNAIMTTKIGKVPILALK